jgi:hypothetical protein
MAAAASSLKSQANDLVQSVAVFNLGGDDRAFAPPKPSVRISAPKASPFQGSERRLESKATAAPRAAAPTPKSLPKPAPKVAAKPAPAGGDEDWETF